MVITVSVLDYVDSCYSNDDGAVVFEIIDSLLNKKNKVIVSFEGINSITSSFTNTAFVELIKNMIWILLNKICRLLNLIRRSIK